MNAWFEEVDRIVLTIKPDDLAVDAWNINLVDPQKLVAGVVRCSKHTGNGRIGCEAELASIAVFVFESDGTKINPRSPGLWGTIIVVRSRHKDLELDLWHKAVSEKE